MAIVGETSSEGRAIVEGVGFAAMRKVNLPSEGINFPPPVEDHTLFGREINGHDGRGCRETGGGILCKKEKKWRRGTFFLAVVVMSHVLMPRLLVYPGV